MMMLAHAARVRPGGATPSCEPLCEKQLIVINRLVITLLHRIVTYIV